MTCDSGQGVDLWLNTTFFKTKVILILTKYYHADSTKVLESSLWRPFISEQLPFNSEGSRGLGYLSTVLLQGDRSDTER
ncbi:VPS10 domain-containing receptor [Collichthys lucidus]|uniref:VPS10 domain-containing receptor n=1 Tax=Collichthys lucidus TaxID=240159 RepID=A0A4U5VV13_COLLU|nr:VPS10 domain-containing receptor [Collichthys lucidus]